MDGNTAQPNVVWESHLESHQNKANDDMPENFPKQNGIMLESSNTTHNGVMNGIFSEPHPKVQPFVEKISFEKHLLLKSGSRKRKRGSFSIDTTNLQEVKHSRIELPQSPSSPTWSSVVTVLKYQDGEFVKIHSPSSSYNSPMSLQDMRKAIMASLESFISQPNIDIQSPMEPVPPVNLSPEEPSPKVKEMIVEKFPAPTEKKIKVPKEVERDSSFSQVQTKKVKSPNKESIKFANRQRELMRMKKEMKNKLKNENLKDGDQSDMGIWGRTVGVSCTMCGKHVQKSYGCFRRDNAPERLVYLFTPGMNRIKICRRCLPYKKQAVDGEPEKKPGKKLGGKVPVNNSKKSNNVNKNTVNKALLKAIKKNASQKKPVSTSTLDAIQRKLTTSNETADPKLTQNIQRKIILGQSGKSDAMEYIKKLAENIKANYNKEAEPADKSMKTPLSQQHVSALTPITASSNQIAVSLSTKLKEPKTSCVTTQWTPLVVSQGSSSTKPMTTLANIRLSVQQKKTGSNSTPPWTPLIVQQVQSPGSTSPLTLGRLSEASTSKAVSKFALSTSKELQTIPAIVVSSQNAVPGKSPVLLQIQRVRLMKEKTGEGKELKMKVKVDDHPTIGKNKIVRTSTSTSFTNVHRSTTCVSCQSNVEESYRYVNQSSSPPKLQHLFTNETEVLSMCQKCLSKESEEMKAETDEKQNESTGGDSQEFPGTFMDQGDLACTSENNNQDLVGTLGDKSSSESLENNGTLGDTDESVGIESAGDVNNSQSLALNGTVRNNCESHGPQGTSSLSGEKVETVEPVEVLQEESLENDAVKPLESVGGLVASSQDEFMLGESDMIESAVPFVVGSDGNLGPEAVDFLGIGDASLPEDNGVPKDSEELLGRYDAEGILKDVLDAKENEELIKKSGGLKDAMVEYREEKSTLPDVAFPLVKESSIEDADTVVIMETSVSKSQEEGEFSVVETTAITKNNAYEVDRNEESSQESICEEAGNSLSTYEDVLSERKAEADGTADRKEEKEKKKSDGKKIGKEKNKGKSFRREESEMKDNGEKESESERKEIEKEKSEEDGIVKEESERKDNVIEKNEEEIKERKDNENQETERKSVAKEMNEGDSIGREESLGKDIGKEQSERKDIGEEESKQESIGKVINERNTIGSGESERNEIKKVENEEKSIGKEMNEEKSIETEESKEKSIGKEESGGKERKVVSEKIVNKEEEISNENKESGLKESAKNEGSGKRIKTASKSPATENEAVKENDKRLRQRRTVATAKTSPAKSEKKTVAKWHDKTRGALLKKQKAAEKEAGREIEKETVSETTQGVKRKNEKRPGRGKKAKVEDCTSTGETKGSKEESTKDIHKGSPSKRMKTRKELH